MKLLSFYNLILHTYNYTKSPQPPFKKGGDRVLDHKNPTFVKGDFKKIKFPLLCSGVTGIKRNVSKALEIKGDVHLSSSGSLDLLCNLATEVGYQVAHGGNEGFETFICQGLTKTWLSRYNLFSLIPFKLQKVILS